MKHHPFSLIGRNDAGGVCARCGKYVPRGKGFTRRPTPEEMAAWGGRNPRGFGTHRGPRKNLKWVNEHLQCRARWAGTLHHYNHPEAGVPRVELTLDESDDGA